MTTNAPESCATALTSTCMSCGKAQIKMLKCKLCKDKFGIDSYYCSKQCQENNWNIHKFHHKEMELTKSTGQAGSIKINDEHDDVKKNHGVTRLISACLDGEVQEAERLLLMKADPAATDINGLNSLHHALARTKLAVVELLLKYADPSIVYHAPTLLAPKGSTSLHLAALQGSADFIGALIKVGGVELVLRENKHGATALHWACRAGNLDAIRLMAESGGMQLVLKPEKNGTSCLHHACSRGEMHIMKLLLSIGGADLLAMPNHAGDTCLHIASHKGLASAIDLLLDFVELRGAHVILLARNRKGETCLHVALESSRLGIAAALAGAGGAPLLLLGNRDGSTCLHQACIIGDLPTVETLVRIGGEPLVAALDDMGLSSMHHAAFQRGAAGPAVVAVLCGTEAGKRALCSRVNGRTPLDVAVEVGNHEIARVLRQAAGAAKGQK